MNIMELLDKLQKKAMHDEQLKQELLATKNTKNPLENFCRIAREEGFDIYEMDVIQAGEEFYASMRRSTNGGGENSPMLEGEDDFYELFLAGLK